MRLRLGAWLRFEGTIDTRGDSLRATAQKVNVLPAEHPNSSVHEKSATPIEEPAVLLQFSPATTKDELRKVREILASCPGQRRVQLLFDRPAGHPLRVDAGADFRVDLTRELEEKLSRWLVTTKSERRKIAVDPAAI